MSYLSASAVVIHYEEALYQVYAPLPLYTSKLIILILYDTVTLVFDPSAPETVQPISC